MKKIGRFDYIDALRGWAIIGVMITHAGLRTLDGSGFTALARRATDLGAMGVQLFYMVSAFTILLLFEKRHIEEIRPVGSFYIRRLMRIAPVYWAGIIIYTAIYGLTGSRGWLDGPELWHYPFHFLFLNMTNPFTPSTVVPGGWSISNEVIFYIIFPALFYIVRTLKGAFIMFALFTFTSPMWAQLAQYIVEVAYPSATLKEATHFSYRWLPNQLPCFAAGFLMLHLARDDKDSLLLNRVRQHGNLAALSLALALPLIIFLSTKTSIDKNAYWGCWFLALGVVLSVHQWRILVNKPTVWLGKISFSCYIVHFIVIDILLRLIPRTHPLADFAVITILTIPITAAISSFSFIHFEQPFGRLSKKIVDLFQGNKNHVEITEKP